MKVILTGATGMLGEGGYPKQILEIEDIRALAEKNQS